MIFLFLIAFLLIGLFIVFRLPKSPANRTCLANAGRPEADGNQFKFEKVGQVSAAVPVDLEADLVQAIENKDIKQLSNIRNKAMNLGFRLKDEKLERIKAVAMDIELFLQRNDDYVPLHLAKSMPEEWAPSWWLTIKESAGKWQEYHDERDGRREESKRIGVEDDFVSFANFKPLPTTYWSERREILLPVVMDYVSAKGVATRREVDITTFAEGVSDNGGPDVYVDGFCHMRNARRTFLASRAKSITIVATGEIFNDVNQFRDYLGGIYSNSLEGRLDAFFGSHGAEISEIVLFIGRAEGRLKNRVKKILLDSLAELSGVSVDDLKTSKVCKEVFKVVGFDSRDFKQSVKNFGEKVYEDRTLYASLEDILGQIVVDNRGVVDEVMAAMVKKTLKKVAPPPEV